MTFTSHSKFIYRPNSIEFSKTRKMVTINLTLQLIEKNQKSSFNTYTPKQGRNVLLFSKTKKTDIPTEQLKPADTFEIKMNTPADTFSFDTPLILEEYEMGC